MKMLHRKLIRDLYKSRWLLLAITSIIAVGVMCYVSMQSAYHNLSAAQKSYYRRCRMADIWVDLKKAPVSAAQDVKQIPGVLEAETRIQFSATIDLPDVVKPVNSFVLALPDRRTPVMNDIILQRGSYFTSHRMNEAIVNEAFAQAHGLLPGDSIRLLLNNRSEEFYLVGTGISSEFTYLLGPGELVPDPANFGVVYIKHSYAEELFDFEGAANCILARTGELSASDMSEVTRKIEGRLDSYGVFAVTPLKRQPSNQFLTGEIDGLGAFATVVPVIFLAVAALVLNVLVTRLARGQRTVVGTLKALGYSDGSVFRHFLGFGLIVGVLGGLLGCGLGYLSATGMTVMYRQYFEFPELPSRFYAYTHGIGMAISLACAVSGSWQGARGMLRLQAAEAMRPEPPRSGHAVWPERCFPVVWRRLSSGWRMAIRSVFRARLRTAAALFAATMGAGLLSCGFMLYEAGNFLLEFQFERVASSDIDLSFESERGRAAISEVGALPGVDHVEPVLNVACDFSCGPYQRKAGIMGLDQHARLTTPLDVHGERIDLPRSGLVLSSRLAEILHAAPGDTVTIKPVKGERRSREVAVARVADSYMGLVAYADIEYLSRLIGENYAVTGVQLSTSRSREQQARLYRELKRTPAIQAVVARRDMADNLRKTLLQNQLVFIGMLILFAGVIFFGSIVNAAMVSLTERRREVGTLLALGYDVWQVGGVFLRENMLTTVTGAIAGLPVGYLLTLATVLSYNNDLIRMPIVSPPWIWWATLGLAVLFGMVAHAVVHWQIARLDYVEALKVKE